MPSKERVRASPGSSRAGRRRGDSWARRQLKVAWAHPPARLTQVAYFYDSDVGTCYYGARTRARCLDTVSRQHQTTEPSLRPRARAAPLRQAPTTP